MGPAAFVVPPHGDNSRSAVGLGREIRRENEKGNPRFPSKLDDPLAYLLFGRFACNSAQTGNTPECAQVPVQVWRGRLNVWSRRVQDAGARPPAAEEEGEEAGREGLLTRATVFVFKEGYLMETAIPGGTGPSIVGKAPPECRFGAIHWKIRHESMLQSTFTVYWTAILGKKNRES